MKTEQLVQLERVDYAVQKTKILDQISFDVDLGACTCLLGKNGSGKSTLIDLITGDLKPTAGNINYYQNQPLKNRPGDLSVLYEFMPFYPMLKVKEIIHLFGFVYSHNKSTSDQLVEQLELRPIMSKLFSKLSRGERKKVGLFVALFHNPKILIMDEPMVELDPLIRAQIWNKLIFSKNRTVFFTTHNWDEAQDHADKIIFLYEGQIIGSMTAQDKTKIRGKKILISEQVNLPKSILNTTQYIIYENQYYLFPELNHEKDLIEKINQITLNYSVQDKKLEDIYQLLISSSKNVKS